MPLCLAPLSVGSLVCSRVTLSPYPMPCLTLYGRTLDTSISSRIIIISRVFTVQTSKVWLQKARLETQRDPPACKALSAPPPGKMGVDLLFSSRARPLFSAASKRLWSS